MKVFVVGVVTASLLLTPVATADASSIFSSRVKYIASHQMYENADGDVSEYDYDFDEPELENSEEFLEILEEDDPELLGVRRSPG